MRLVLIHAEAFGYYSGTTWEEDIFVSEEFYEKIKNTEIEIYVPEIDGKHSVTDADITISRNISAVEMIGEGILPQRPDGDYLHLELESICKDLGLNLEKEIDRVYAYIESLNIDPYVTIEVRVRKSKLESFNNFVRNLEWVK